MKPETAATMTPATSGAGSRGVLLQILGLQRSGNHAIIDWLESLYPTALHLNEQPHAFFEDAESVAAVRAALAKTDCVIVSFEDAVGVSKLQGKPFLDNVRRLDPEDFPGHACHVLHILRDPYNCWASRVKARERGRLSSSRRLEDFRRDWVDIARLAERTPDAVVLYNAWHGSRRYREALCARLGGSYSERTLREVRSEGGGSSFDGYGRPTWRTIAGNLGYYCSKRFRKRFLSAPGSYLARLFARPVDGRSLKVDSRWQHVLDHEASRPLFSDAEIRSLSDRIFGFHVEAGGEMRKQPQAAGTVAPAE
ncbi:MAG TPA: hypothetical protein VFN28_08010 [Amaricoccus sp.]|nr:hypothetical protein [Amaricoccus sp.]